MKILATLALVLAIALALTPTASPHAEAFSQAKSLAFGPLNAVVTPKPSPMFADSSLSMTALFSDGATGKFVTRDIDASLQLVDPALQSKTQKLEPDGTGYFLASITVGGPGNYTANIVLRDGSQTYTNGTSFTVYPEIGLRFATEDPKQPDPIVGEPYTFSIVTLDTDGVNVVDKLTDLTVTVERWSDDHKQMFGAESFPMTHAGKGLWRLSHSYSSVGMIHLRFASQSGRFSNDDVPILHSYAYAPPPGQKKPIPTPVPLPVVALIGLGAALIRRRDH